ncbi:MAG: ferredoxin [Aeromicrobium sp.]
MKVVADEDRCGGHGLCEAIAPDHFEVQGNGLVTVLRDDIDEGDLVDIEDAVASCPTEALRIED